jgi:hypothetical protein
VKAYVLNQRKRQASGKIEERREEAEAEPREAEPAVNGGPKPLARQAP